MSKWFQYFYAWTGKYIHFIESMIFCNMVISSAPNFQMNGISKQKQTDTLSEKCCHILFLYFSLAKNITISHFLFFIAVLYGLIVSMFFFSVVRVTSFPVHCARWFVSFSTYLLAWLLVSGLIILLYKVHWQKEQTVSLNICYRFYYFFFLFHQ